MAERQFSGLPMNRQLYWAEEYKRRFPKAVIDLGGFASADVSVRNLPSYPDPESALVLRELDNKCHEEWLQVTMHP